MAAAAAKPEAREPASGHPTWTLVATGLGLFMIFLDASIVNVALPEIQRDFDSGESGLQWIVAGYSLTMAAFMMAGGTFADLRGRRLAYVIGLIVFSLMSAACALAPGIEVLSAARAVQGVGAAITNVASLALVGAAFPDPKAKAKAIGVWTGIAAVGFTLGPLVGGVLTEQAGWRSIFVLNPVVGAVALFLTVRYVAESRDPHDRSFDPSGQVLFLAGIGALTYGLIEGPHSGWLSPEILATFGVAVVGLVLLARVELRSAQPMMDLHVFRDRVYSTAIYVIFAVLFAAYGTLLVVTQYFQNVEGYSPEKTGLLMFAMGVPVIFLAPVAGRIAAEYGGRRPTVIGMASGSLGVALFVVASSHLVLVVLGLMLLGVAAGLTVAAATSVAMSSIDPARSGMASGILSTQRGLGSTAGYAIMGSVLAATVSFTLPDKLEPLIPDAATRTEVVDRVTEDANPRAVAALIGPGKPLPDNVKSDDELLAAADDAFIDGIRVAMLVALAVLLSALLLAWFLFPRGRLTPQASSGRAG